MLSMAFSNLTNKPILPADIAHVMYSVAASNLEYCYWHKSSIMPHVSDVKLRQLWLFLPGSKQI